MKRFALMMLVVLTAITSFAQSDEPKPVVPTEHVVLPDNAVPLAYMLDATGEESTDDGDQQPYHVKKSTQVVFLGNDVYVQGLSYFFPEAWVKGTINGTKATFKSPQLYGTDDEGSVYFWGYDWDSEQQVDVVFDYDPEARTLVSHSYILENGDATERYCFDYFHETKLYPGEPKSKELVELPKDAEVREYHFNGLDTYYDKTTDMPVAVAFCGQDVYVQGLSEALPEAWVKGTLADDGTVSFEADQYLGCYEFLFWEIDLFFSGATFSYDAEKGVLTASKYFTADEDGTVWDQYANVVLSVVNDVAATPKAPRVTGFDYDKDFGYSVHLDVPLESTDGNYLLASKLSYQLFYNVAGTVAPYVLSAQDYKYVDADMTVVPYTYRDDWDVYHGGVTVYLYGNVGSWTRVGVKSIYTGGNETHESNIVWRDLTTVGIVGTTQTRQQSDASTLFDMQGRPANGSQRGLLIERQRHADGSVTVKKIMK